MILSSGVGTLAHLEAGQWKLLFLAPFKAQSHPLLKQHAADLWPVASSPPKSGLQGKPTPLPGEHF